MSDHPSLPPSEENERAGESEGRAPEAAKRKRRRTRKPREGSAAEAAPQSEAARKNGAEDAAPAAAEAAAPAAGPPAGPADSDSDSDEPTGQAARDGGAELDENGQRRRRRRRRRRRKPGAEAASLSTDVQGCREIARRRFGIDRLHPEQERAMEAVLQGKDTLVVLPTGFGKSLIYQVPAMLLDRPTIVVSPLIALMADQEQSLKRRGVPVVRIDSTLKVAEKREALERVAAGGRLVVLTTPESLESEKTRPFFAQANPAILCVDEAHCISEWGHDFRPAYLRLGTERRFLGSPTVLALTATATPKVRDDVSARLRLQDPVLVTAPPHRDNLRLGVEQVPGNLKPEAAGRLLKRLQRPGIVYCSTTVEVDNIWLALNKARIPAARYHGKMKTEERSTAQKRYMKPSKRLVMVATSAFGMGIDKPNIRYILHYQAPGSLEQYVQEAGRAGRDGLPSHCTFLFDEADLRVQDHLQKQSRANARQLMRVAQALKAWAADNRPVNAADLALSAEVPATTCRSLCAQLEEVGLVELDEERRYVVQVGPEELIQGAEDLAGRFETLRTEDVRRLAAVKEYAQTEECRSVFIRRYFGEDDPPECGKCDRCRAKRHHAQTLAKFSRSADAIVEGEEPEGGKRKRRRRRRKKGGDRQQAAGGEAAPRPQPQQNAGEATAGEGGGRRKRRRRRRGNKGGEGPRAQEARGGEARGGEARGGEARGGAARGGEARRGSGNGSGEGAREGRRRDRGRSGDGRGGGRRDPSMREAARIASAWGEDIDFRDDFDFGDRGERPKATPAPTSAEQRAKPLVRKRRPAAAETEAGEVPARVAQAGAGAEGAPAPKAFVPRVRVVEVQPSETPRAYTGDAASVPTTGSEAAPGQPARKKATKKAAAAKKAPAKKAPVKQSAAAGDSAAEPPAAKKTAAKKATAKKTPVVKKATSKKTPVKKAAAKKAPAKKAAAKKTPAKKAATKKTAAKKSPTKKRAATGKKTDDAS
jgi:ATP-dependent DNA helicase RecQ